MVKKLPDLEKKVKHFFKKIWKIGPNGTGKGVVEDTGLYKWGWADQTYKHLPKPNL